jgi:hypothetical protein
MMPTAVYFHSPFSPADVAEANNQVLLLLFILKELIRHPTEAAEGLSPTFAPFDWSQKASSFQKLREHFSLLPFAFPDLEPLIPSLYQNLHSTDELLSLLQPFILACCPNENLLLFLIQHQNELAVKPFLDKICPQGLDVVKEKIALSFRKRGYHFTRWIQSPKRP